MKTPYDKVDLSAKFAHIGVSSINQNIDFSQTIGPIDLKFHMKIPYDKIYRIFWSHDQDDRQAYIMVKNL